MGDGKLPWMKFYPSDFMGSRKVRSMTGIQRGIYISLMCKCWETDGGAILDDPEEHWMECGVTPEQMRDAWPKVRACFEESGEQDGYIVQPRVQEEWEKAMGRRRRARKAWKASADKRAAEHGAERPVERGAQADSSSGTGEHGGGASLARSELLGSSSTDSSSQGEGKEREEREGCADWMHAIWHEELGYDGHPIKLTEKRRQKYGAMHEEHLACLDDPRLGWRAVLKCVKRSDHHMSVRAYQMPESILKNPERRERWIQTVVDTAQSDGRTAGDRKVVDLRERLERVDLKEAM